MTETKLKPQAIYDTGWVTMTLVAGTASYGSPWGDPSYRKIGSVVYLRGLIAGTANNVVFTTLPAGFRPSVRLLISVQINPNVIGRLDIYTNGNLYPSITNGAWLSLHGISFVADL